MAPQELAAYFGSKEKPECHLLYNAAVMANFWDSLASQNVVLLEEQLSLIFSLPPHAHFVNYLRCHDDIGWALDAERQRAMGQDPLEHKKFVYQFFAGQFPFSYSRGELYNYDAVSQDARSCGTTASFCGLEAALEQHDEKALQQAISRDLFLHAVMFSVEGFPLLSSGDEIGQLNDYSYKNNPIKCEDQRNVHRSPFRWDQAEKRKVKGTYQQQIFSGIQKILQVKKQSNCFSPQATVQTWKSHNDKVLIVRRVCGAEELLCIANFSDTREHFYTECLVGSYQDLFTGEELTPGWGYEIKSHAYIWAQKRVSSSISSEE
jgi:amylosucrase